MRHATKQAERAGGVRSRSAADGRLPGWRRAAPLLLALLLLLVLPDALHACPVCFDSSAANRKAFLYTAIFMTVLPLGMVAGAGLWVRRRSRRIDEEMGEGGPET